MEIQEFRRNRMKIAKMGIFAILCSSVYSRGDRQSTCCARLFPRWIYLLGGVHVRVHGPFNGTDSYKLSSTVSGPEGGVEE